MILTKIFQFYFKYPTEEGMPNEQIINYKFVNSCYILVNKKVFGIFN